MLTFTEIKVSHYARNQLHVSWQYEVSEGDVDTNYSFELMRSESREHGYDSIMDVDVDQRSFVDGSVNTFSKERVYFYKVVASLISNPTQQEESAPGRVCDEPDAVALEIVRKERLLLRMYVKTKCYVYTAISTGQRCTYCWNPVTKAVSRSNCPVCFGTGFEAGLYKPEPVYIDFDPDSPVLRNSDLGPMEIKDTNAWTSNFPALKSNDFIKEVNNGNIWKIGSISTIKKNRYILKQLFRITEVERGSQMYDFKIPDVWEEPWEATYLSGVEHEELP